MAKKSTLWKLPLGVILIAYLVLAILAIAGINLSSLAILEKPYLSIWLYPLLLGACSLFCLTLYQFNTLKNSTLFERAFWSMIAMLCLSTLFGIVINISHFSPDFIKGGGVSLGISLTAIIFIISKGKSHVDLLQIYVSLGYMILTAGVAWTIFTAFGSCVAYIFSSMGVSLFIAACVGSLLVLLYTGIYKLFFKRNDREPMRFMF